MKIIEGKIHNEKGLTSRLAALLVGEANHFKSNLTIKVFDETADLKFQQQFRRCSQAPAIRVHSRRCLTVSFAVPRFCFYYSGQFVNALMVKNHIVI